LHWHRGIDAEEAEALIASLADHIVKPAFILSPPMASRDLLMWDNCTVQHRAIQDYRSAATAADAPHDHGGALVPI